MHPIHFCRNIEQTISTKPLKCFIVNTQNGKMSPSQWGTKENSIITPSKRRSRMLSWCCPFEWMRRFALFSCDCHQDEQIEMSYIHDNPVWWAPLCYLNHRLQKRNNTFSKPTAQCPAWILYFFKPKIPPYLRLRCSDVTMSYEIKIYGRQIRRTESQSSCKHVLK